MHTVLITGCSSGFGLETARFFLDRDWTVIATMRKVREDVLPRSERLRLLALDVTDAASIRGAVEAAGPIDVLVNNAGIGMLGPLEGTSMETTRQVFETNTFGTIAMTQAVLPQFRQRKTGVIVNVTSSVTLKPLPLLSVYTASKAAVTAFTESLAAHQFFRFLKGLVSCSSFHGQPTPRADVLTLKARVGRWTGRFQRGHRPSFGEATSWCSHRSRRWSVP